MKNKKGLFVTIIAILIGGIGGFLYWRFIGCTSGTCPIKSVWYFSTLWGMAAGYLAGDIVLSAVSYYKRRRNDKTV